MKKIILIVLIVTVLFSSAALVAGACLPPLKPMPTLKPIWCQGRWTQQLVCDANCNCYWQEVCLQ